MSDLEMEKIIIGIKRGNIEALEKLLKQYEPLINSKSIINGKMDYYCKSFIIERIIKEIKKFNI